MNATWSLYFTQGIFVYIVIALVFIRYFWKGYIFKADILKMDNLDNKELFVNIYKIHHKKIDLCILLILGIIAAFIFILETLPMLQDYSLLKRNEYEILIGYADTEDIGRRGAREQRGVEITEIGTGEKISIYMYTTEINKGDYLVIHYLPHSGIGEVIEQRSTNQ